MNINLDGVKYYPKGRWPKNGERSNQLLLIRLLRGTMDLETNSTKVIQDTDYSIVPPCRHINSANRTKGAFKYFATNYAVGGNLALFIKKTTPMNRPFFEDLLGEFSHHFIQTKKEAHLAAFVFLYRILERISYSIPLLYSTLSNDFIDTFNDMKSLFSPESGGELGLFKKFLNQGKFIDSIILDTTYKIRFTSKTGNQDKYFSLINYYFKSFSSTDSNISEVEIKFRDVPDLLIALRNRFFHFKTGNSQKNIAIKELQDPDEFFFFLNKVFCSFLAIVSLHAIASTS